MVKEAFFGALIADPARYRLPVIDRPFLPSLSIPFSSDQLLDKVIATVKINNDYFHSIGSHRSTVITINKT